MFNGIGPTEIWTRWTRFELFLATKKKKKKNRNEAVFNGIGPTEIWTRIAGFKVQSANHYTMGPRTVTVLLKIINTMMWIFITNNKNISMS